MKQKLIDKEKLRMELRKLFFEYRRSIDQWLAYAVEDVIDNIPTIEAESIRRGKWIGKPIGGYSNVKCSACGHVFLENNGRWKYCPDCGARNDGKGEES